MNLKSELATYALQGETEAVILQCRTAFAMLLLRPGYRMGFRRRLEHILDELVKASP